MKKLNLLVLSILFFTTVFANGNYSAITGSKIYFVTVYGGSGPVHNGSVGNPSTPRTPIQPPTVYLDGHTLILYTEHDGQALDSRQIVHE